MKVLVTTADIENGQLVVTVMTATLDKTRKGTVAVWANGASLRDDQGNRYTCSRYDRVLHSLIEGTAQQAGKAIAAGPGAVYSDLPRMELLHFERPVLAAGFLDLDLDGRVVGGRATIQFRIPREMWQP